MLDKIEQLKKEFYSLFSSASTKEELFSIRVKFLGRKDGLVTRLFDEFKILSVDQKRQVGPKLNQLKAEVEDQLTSKENGILSQKNLDLDPTLPGLKVDKGHLHPITQFQKEVEKIFSGLGFDIQLGPEIESDFFNFESLNIPENHPARDMQDTFYLDIEHPKGKEGKNIILRTHISSMQVRYMREHKPPFSVVLPGRVYRNEAVDASHEHTYQYMEGFVVGEDITFANMTWTLDYAMKNIFGNDIKTKLLPSYFPFVEPGAEVAISCLICKGKGCSVCKKTGWVEILGCGMIHQKVFEYAGYKTGQYQGFAFGFGLSRLAMMKYSIPDIRLLAENDLRFLKQF